MTSEIDKLLITIGADITPNLSKQISGIANAIKRLDKVINDANLNKMQQYLGTLSNLTVGGIGVPRGSSSGANKVFSSARGKILRGQTTGISNVTNIGIGTGASNKQDLQNLGILKSQQYYTAINSAKKLKNVYSEIGKTFRRTTSEINGMKKSIKGQNSEAKKGTTVMSGFAKSIGRIALYRTIRRALQLITQGIEQGLENIRQLDTELDDSLNKIKASGNSLANSFGALLAPILKELTPLIIAISDAIADVANTVNETLARLQNKDSYFKILTSDTEEWQKQLQKAKNDLFEFDKFVTLGEREDNTSTIQETKVGDEAEGYNFFEDFTKGIVLIANWIKILFDSVWEFFNSFDNDFIRPIKEQLSDIGDFFTSTIPNFFVNLWNNIKSFFTSTIPNFFVDVWTGIKKGWSGIFGGYYADGGMLPQTTGSLAMVGEAGAEIVASGRGGTGVTNVEQFTTAMYNALSMYGVARGTDVTFSGDVYMNTSKVGKLVENSAYNEGVRVGHFNKIR